MASAAGEPLNAAVIDWFEGHANVRIHDHYGQTENGMLVINHQHLEAKATEPARAARDRTTGMGVAMVGYSAVIIDPETHAVLPAGAVGLLAINVPDSPLFWFGTAACGDGYHGQTAASLDRFVGTNGRFYTTGDMCTMGEDGRFFYSARSDDIITSNAFRIGPFEVESAILKHDAVAEVAVVGLPDEQRGER